MKRLFSILFIIGTAGLLALAIVRSRGETLYNCQFRLSSPKGSYKVGDKVTLIAEIIPETERDLTLSSNLCRNLFLWNMRQVNPKQLGLGEKVRYRFSADQPLRFIINGSVVSNQNSEVWVDFEDFGRGQITNGVFPELRFSVRPYKVRAVDSREWPSSNILQLKLE